MLLQRCFLNIFLLAPCLIATGIASAQSYPTKPIRFVVPFTPGGSQDVIGRLFAQKVSDSMGHQVVVDNRGGAAGLIAAELVAKAPPDGYTIFLVTGGPISLAPALHAKLPYDPLKDFVHITQLVDTPMALIVTTSLPAKSVADLIALAKTKPLNYASTGNGSISHLTMEALKLATGTNMTHVPYKGAAPAFIDMLSGQVSLMFTSTASAAPYTSSGKLRALAVASRKRTAMMPDAPTLIEAGIKNFESTVWVGVSATGGTPQVIVKRLHDEFVRALKAPDLTERLAALGAEPVGSTPEQFAALIREDIARWARVVKASGVRLD
jgi:tripartite-type tricarboxylate transporter receptor subunit TctC